MTFSNLNDSHFDAYKTTQDKKDGLWIFFILTENRIIITKSKKSIILPIHDEIYSYEKCRVSPYDICF